MRPWSAGWMRFLGRLVVVLLAGGATFAAAFFPLQWLLPGFLTWSQEHVRFAGRDELLGALADYGALGLAGAISLAVLRWTFLWAVRVPEDRKGVPGRVVFGAVPRPPQHWQVRDEKTRELRRAMGRPGRAALVALSGERGAGKSHLAAAYARRCIESGYDLVAWINAETGAVASLADLARQLDLVAETPEALAARLRTWLQNQPRRRRLLIVLDNVDDVGAVTPYLPATGPAKILVTTNRGEFREVAGFTEIKVGMFTQPEGRAYLRQATGLPDDADAEALGSELGWLPLGMAQAAAFIRTNQLTYRRYRTLLDEQPLDATLRRQAGTGHPGVLRATALSLAGLARDDPTGDATRLLTVLALLSPDGVSRALLAKAATTLGLSGGLIAALNVLAAANIVTLAGLPADDRGQDGVTVSVHRLTARVIRFLAARPDATFPSSEAADVATQLLDNLTDDLPLAVVARRRTEVEEVVAHILAAHANLTEPSELLLVQMDWAGRLLQAAGDLIRSIMILERSLADRVRVLGDDHPNTLTSRNNLAGAYESAGRLDEAITLYQHTLNDCVRVLGERHSLTKTVGGNLARARQGRV